jgi:hypothetical protein
MPFYLFVSQDKAVQTEYMEGWKITEAMPTNVLGFQTHRDYFAIAFEEETIRHRIELMREKGLSDAKFSERFKVKDNRDWQLSMARRQVRADKHWQEHIILCSYRPFDDLWCYFSTVAMDYPRRELLRTPAPPSDRAPAPSPGPGAR